MHRADPSGKRLKRKSILIRLAAFFTPESYIQAGYESRHRARVLLSTCLILFLFGIGYSIIYRFRYEAIHESNLLLFGSVFVLATPFIFKHTKSHKLPSNYALLLMLVMLYHHMIGTGAIRGPTVIWFPLVPSIAVILLGTRAAMIWGLLSTGIVSYVFVRQLNGYQYTHVVSPELRLQSSFTSYFGLAMIIPILLGIYEKAKLRMLAEMQSLRKSCF